MKSINVVVLTAGLFIISGASFAGPVASSLDADTLASWQTAERVVLTEPAAVGGGNTQKPPKPTPSTPNIPKP